MLHQDLIRGEQEVQEEVGVWGLLEARALLDKVIPEVQAILMEVRVVAEGLEQRELVPQELQVEMEVMV